MNTTLPQNQKEAPKVQTALQMLQDPALKLEIKKALPRHMSPDRILRIAMTELRKNPKLGQCEPKSFIGSIVQCSQLGLEPGSQLGHAYLVPYKEKGIDICQLIIGYRGMIELAMRSDKIKTLVAQVVKEGDLFEYERGLEQKLKHIEGKDRGKDLYYYAYALLHNGGCQFEVMTVNDVNAIMQKTPNYQNPKSPWQTNYEEMGKKTLIRRLFKYLPISIELVQASIIDEAPETGRKSDLLIEDLFMTEDENLTYDSETGEVIAPDKADALADRINA